LEFEEADREKANSRKVAEKLTKPPNEGAPAMLGKWHAVEETKGQKEALDKLAQLLGRPDSERGPSAKLPNYLLLKIGMTRVIFPKKREID